VKNNRVENVSSLIVEHNAEHKKDSLNTIIYETKKKRIKTTIKCFLMTNSW